MALWDYLFNLADPDHPRIKREGQDFVASNPPGTAGSVLRFFTQNREKDSPNTAEIRDAARQGIKEEIVWISPQPGVGQSQRQRPVAVAKTFQDARGNRSGFLADLRLPDQPIIVEYPEEIDLDVLAAMAREGQAQQRPDQARAYIDQLTGERYATTQQVPAERAAPVVPTSAAQPASSDPGRGRFSSVRGRNDNPRES